MKTARELAHELAAGVVPCCYSVNFDDGAGTDTEHSHHCDFLTAAIEADRRQVRAAALREVHGILIAYGEKTLASELEMLARKVERGEDCAEHWTERAERGE